MTLQLFAHNASNVCAVEVFKVSGTIVLQTRLTTTNLITHLRSRHPDHSDEFVKREREI